MSQQASEKAEVLVCLPRFAVPHLPPARQRLSPEAAVSPVPYTELTLLDRRRLQRCKPWSCKPICPREQLSTSASCGGHICLQVLMSDRTTLMLRVRTAALQTAWLLISWHPVAG